MFVTPIKGFPHQRLGFLAKGATVEVSEDEGRRLIRMGLVNPAAAPYATKVVSHSPVTGPLPSSAGGEVQASSASPAAPASPQTIVKESVSGKKRGRPRKNGA